jgi:hypothetical protein
LTFLTENELGLDPNGSDMEAYISLPDVVDYLNSIVEGNKSFKILWESASRSPFISCNIVYKGPLTFT